MYKITTYDNGVRSISEERPNQTIAFKIDGAEVVKTESIIQLPKTNLGDRMRQAIDSERKKDDNTVKSEKPTKMDSK